MKYILATSFLSLPIYLLSNGNFLGAITLHIYIFCLFSLLVEVYVLLMFHKQLISTFTQSEKRIKEKKGVKLE